MAEDHQFTVRLEPDSFRKGRFHWALFKATQVYNRSQMSFATKREAAADAAKVLEKRIAAWHAQRDAEPNARVLEAVLKPQGRG